MTEFVRPPGSDDPPLVDPETGETPPLSPRRLSVTQAYDRARIITAEQFLDAAMLTPQRLEHLVFVVDPVFRRAYVEGDWNDVMESNDAP